VPRKAECRTGLNSMRGMVSSRRVRVASADEAARLGGARA
jgi:hypothetical protein